MPEIGTYQACWRNELASLYLRHLGDNPKLDPKFLKDAARAAVKVVNQHVDRKWTPEEVVAHKNSPAARKRYAKAFSELAETGLRPTDYNISAFIKVEKWNIGQLGVKPPRLIQYRSYRYGALLAQYLCPIEQAMWKTRVNEVPVFAKGRNSYEVAAQLRQAWERCVDPVAVLIDHSRFDSSVMAEHIEMEEYAYLKMYPDDQLADLMKRQKFNRCYTKGGIRYSCVARKMSGEYNTSLGDSFINFAVLLHVFGETAFYVINGDDSVVIVERASLREDVLDSGLWARYGFKSTVEVVADFGSIEFCQSRPVNVDGEWRMVRNPWRAISRGTVSVKRYQGEAWRSLLASMAASEMACSDGVPMLQAWARYLDRCSAYASPLPGEITYRARLERKPKPRDVSPETRDSFAIAFGIPEDVQMAFEGWCETAEAVCIQAD